MADSSLLTAAQTQVLRPDILAGSRTRSAPSALVRSGSEEFVPQSPTGDDPTSDGQRHGGGGSQLVGTQDPLRGLNIPVTTVDTSFLTSNERPDSAVVQRAAAAYQSSQNLGGYAQGSEDSGEGASFPSVNLIA